MHADTHYRTQIHTQSHTDTHSEARGMHQSAREDNFEAQKESANKLLIHRNWEQTENALCDHVSIISKPHLINRPTLHHVKKENKTKVFTSRSWLKSFPCSFEFDRTLMFPTRASQITGGLLNVLYVTRWRLNKRPGALTFVPSHFPNVSEQLKGRSIFPFAWWLGWVFWIIWMMEKCRG